MINKQNWFVGYIRRFYWTFLCKQEIFTSYQSILLHVAMFAQCYICLCVGSQQSMCSVRFYTAQYLLNLLVNAMRCLLDFQVFLKDVSLLVDGVQSFIPDLKVTEFETRSVCGSSFGEQTNLIAYKQSIRRRLILACSVSGHRNA